MSYVGSNLAGDGLSVITICADRETSDRVKQTAQRMYGVFVGDIGEYLPSSIDLQSVEEMHIAGTSVCLIDFDRNRERAAQTANALQRLLQGKTALIAVSAKADPSLILEAMRAGCSEYLTKPLSSDQLGEALSRLRSRWLSQESNKSRPSGRVLAFMGARGGAGTTTLVVHLATFLARLYGKRVLVADIHRQLGHVALYLGLNSTKYHFYDLLRNISRLDVTLFNGLVTHHSSGVDLLPSPDTVDGRLSTSLDAVERAFMFLASVYDFVLIDSPHGVSDLNLATIDHCDILYLLATPDVPGLRDLSRYVDHLLQNKISPDKLKIVINRYSSSGAVSLDQIEKAIRQPISITIPNGFADLVHAMNTGNPVAPERKSEFSIQMKKWAAELVPSATPVVAEPKRKFSFWG